MQGFVHKVNYYETDKMGIVHHSNYIRFMEEARMKYLDDIGCTMNYIEANGVSSPVVSVSCEYKHPTTYGDEIEIEIKVKQYTGVKLTLCYTMRNADTGDVVATAASVHCFVDIEGRPVAVKKSFPELDKILRQLIERNTLDII